MPKTLSEVIAEAEAEFGKGSVMKLTERKGLKVPAQRTGVPQLDIAIGIGGIPKGRIIEIFGPESSGKTTLVLTIIAQAQKDGGWAAFLDMEHSLDPIWAEIVGVDLDRLLVAQPNSAEECLNIARFFINTGVIDVVAIDSVASLVPEAETEAESGKQFIGLQARLMSSEMRRLSPIISKSECIAIFTNQIREKIGVMFGSPETTPGGRALKFYASVRIDVRKGVHIGESKHNAIGNKVKLKIVKNKVAPPFKICEVDLLYKEGFDLSHNLLEAALENDIITVEGKTYKYKDKELGVGKKKTKAAISDMDDDELNELYKDVAGDIIKKTEDSMKEKKNNKLSKALRMYEKTDDPDKKNKYARRIEKLGGALPAASG